MLLQLRDVGHWIGKTASKEAKLNDWNECKTMRIAVIVDLTGLSREIDPAPHKPPVSVPVQMKGAILLVMKYDRSLSGQPY